MSEKPPARPRITLVDAPEEAGRTSASLVSSLAGRLLALHYTSGVSVVGSLVAGIAAVGREVGRTADGARMKKALERGGAARNSEALWRSLRIAEWTAGLPPSPVLDHVRNDLALLLDDDLEATLEDFPIAPPEYGSQQPASAEQVTSIDCLLGLWAYSREVVRSVESLAARGMPGQPEIVPPDEPPHGDELLR